MFEWLKHLFRPRIVVVKSEIAPVEPVAYVAEIPLIKKEVVRPIEEFRPSSIDDLLKQVRKSKIARQNQERQKAVMGYGLKSRNFKPRPAYEKRQWDLAKKPDVEED